jgi:hypothetical protein
LNQFCNYVMWRRWNETRNSPDEFAISANPVWRKGRRFEARRLTCPLNHSACRFFSERKRRVAPFSGRRLEARSALFDARRRWRCNNESARDTYATHLCNSGVCSCAAAAVQRTDSIRRGVDRSCCDGQERASPASARTTRQEPGRRDKQKGPASCRAFN